MQVEIEETGPVERLLKIEVATAEVDAAFEEVFKGLTRKASIKGFRPGKVPRSVVERVYQDQASQEVLERLVQETLPPAVNDHSLDVVSEPRLEPGDPPAPGSAFAYSARLEIRPEIELVKVKGLEIEAPELPEPESDPVEAQLEQLRASQASITELPDGTVAAEGHLAAVDFEGTVGGEPFEGGSGKEMIVELGAGRTIPGFEDELVGLRAGDEKGFDVTFPDDYAAKELEGKVAHFEVKLVGLKQRELPELDDELAKDASNFETLEELRADLAERFEQQRTAELERRTREAVLDAVIEANPFPVPDSLVERELSNRLGRAIQQLHSLPREQLMPMLEQWREEWRPQAERDVRLGFLLPEIAKAESIEASPEDVDERLAEMAERSDQPVDELKKSYRERGLLDALHASVVDDRVVEFLVSAASLSGS
ncbi:MAG: trigger factor [Deltaproteobacteria bacterium]|nr:trigger factor [Deltaproteobacteria bacterium]